MGNDYDKRHKQRPVPVNYVKLNVFKMRFYVLEYILRYSVTNVIVEFFIPGLNLM